LRKIKKTLPKIGSAVLVDRSLLIWTRQVASQVQAEGTALLLRSYTFEFVKEKRFRPLRAHTERHFPVSRKSSLNLRHGGSERTN
jgi:hypothetical protein